MDPRYPSPPRSPSYDLEEPFPWWLLDDFNDTRSSLADDCDADYSDPYEYLEDYLPPSPSLAQARSMIPRTIQNFRYMQSNDGNIESIYYGPDIESPFFYRNLASASDFDELFPSTPPDSLPSPGKRQRTQSQDEDTMEQAQNDSTVYIPNALNMHLHQWMTGHHEEDLNLHMATISSLHEQTQRNIQQEISGSRADPLNQRSESSRPEAEEDDNPPADTDRRTT